MAVTTWNTGPAAARYRMSAKRLKKKATSHKLQAPSCKLQASGASSSKRVMSDQSSSAKHGVSR